MHRHLIITLSAAAVGLAAGCSSTKPAAAPPATTTSVPVTVNSAADSDGLTGFGGTVSDWNATRHPDADANPGSSYGADPSLPQINGHTGARYVAVQPAQGLVTNYQINFHDGTSSTAAMADILRTELPADTVYEWKNTIPAGCYQVQVKSAKLAKALASQDVTSTGEVFIELRSLPAGGVEGYDPSNVTYAMLNLMSYAAASDVGGC
jgi:hypothetical protein